MFTTAESGRPRRTDRVAEAHVAVVGCGYVGLPLAVAAAEAGFSVTGFDTDRVRIAR